MRRYILTGAPGSGKTSILYALGRLGYAGVPEAATDVIAAGQAQGLAEPWHDPDFIGRITSLQLRRQQLPARRAPPAQAPPADGTEYRAAAQVFDRSPVCTLALARYLGHRVPAALAAEIDRIASGQVFERAVFLVRPIGFCEPTAARRMSYAASVEFEKVHQSEYRRLGFELVDVSPGPIGERATAVDAHIRSVAAAAAGR